MVQRVVGILRRFPRSFDAIVALFWLFLSLTDTELDDTGESRLMLMVIFGIASVALYWRRRFPLYVFGFNAIIVIILTIVDVDSPVPAALICATYSLAAHIDERNISIAAFTSFIVAGFASVLFTSPSYIPETLIIVLVLLIAWTIGDSLRTRRAYQRSLVERAERAEALRDSMAQQAVAEERTRIARDLHDVVAHSMSLMVVQAGAARRVAKTNPDASMAALEAIESVGRNSLDEMRRILGVLRGEDDLAATAPQPDIAAIEPLIEEFEAAGLPIELVHAGHPRPLAPSVELTAFRLVQESLTNTLKHAGRATATVTLHYDETELRVVVEDTGVNPPGAASTGQPGGQKGHIGMRERVAAFGGTLTVRPRLDGGYHVSATLPLAPTPATEGTT